MKVANRNNIMKKSNSKWGCNASTIRTTALVMSYSAAEYACPVWARSPHASKLDPELNNACRSITGCLRPTNVEELYLLAGIAPPEKKKQETNAAHSLHSKVLAERHLKKECFLIAVRPADFPAKVIRCSELRGCSVELQGSSNVGIQDSLVFLICLISWGGRLFLKGESRLHLFCFTKLLTVWHKCPC